ncbi:hypothetical protein [Archangium lipolyticum]|uniref:hypothetical protein n=1 Tax=Archangium lipolyticum TaxID=2970465 RepID=UPI00214A5ACC|nr:hypothetical protein [Archangium lipolyticum]
MMNVRMLCGAVGMSMLLTTGCGGPEQVGGEESAEQLGVSKAAVVRSVCWPALGVYAGPGTHYTLLTTLHSGSGNNFDTTSDPFPANGYYWVSGYTTQGGTFGYVRWDGLCH